MPAPSSKTRSLGSPASPDGRAARLDRRARVQRSHGRRQGKPARPGLKALVADARRGQFDMVLVWRFDRFARSVEQLVTALAEFRTLGIWFVSHQEALDN